MFIMGGEKTHLKNLVLQAQYNVFNISAYLLNYIKIGGSIASPQPTRNLPEN